MDALEPSRAAPLAVIWPLLGRHIAFHRRLVDLTANVKAALLLSQSIYWTRHGRDIARSGGWFHKTAEQWTFETGLSVKEQASAREVLRRLALLEDERRGLPARLHFRLRMDELGMRLADRIAGHSGVTDWADRTVLAELLGPSVAFHRTLAGLAGGVHAGLMLSRALHLTQWQLRRQQDHWICSSAARWFEDIGLTRREQETARRALARTGFWEEGLRGIPPSLVARVRLEGLLTLLTECAGAGRAVRSSRGRSDRGVAAGKVALKGASRLWVARSLDAPRPPAQCHPIGAHGSAESARLLEQDSTGASVPPPPMGRGTRPSGLAAGGGELIFPREMLAEEREAARLLLRPCSDQAQSLLDELAGRLQARGVRSSPVAYLRGLIARAAVGRFVPELGLRVAAERRARDQAAALRREREEESRLRAAERASPDHPAEARARREQVSRRLDEIKRRMRAAGQT
jgi:hypothetical protein